MKIILVLVCSLCLLESFALGASSRWRKSGVTHSVVLGAAAPSKSVAFFGGADNGAGAEAFITTDAGVNFVTSKPGGFSYFDVGATDTQTAVLSGFLGGKRTSDQGKTWESILSPLSQCQSVEKIAGKPNAIGMAGHSGEDNGVAVSDDGGKSWNLHEASPGLNMSNGEHARYAAYPSADVWYISGGMWSKSYEETILNKHVCSKGVENRDRGTVHHLLSDRIGLCSGGGYEILPEVEEVGDGNGYVAAIAKTVDGGKTFTNVFRSAGKFYMNGIHCASENHCIAVAEGHNVPQPGTFIVVTRDGGKNWNVTRVGGPRDTLMASRDIDGKEGWALGGVLAIDMELRAWHTMDGGASFTNSGAGVKGISILSADFASSNAGYAACVTPESTSTMAFYN